MTSRWFWRERCRCSGDAESTPRTFGEREKVGREDGIEPSSPGWAPGALPDLCYPRTCKLNPWRVWPSPSNPLLRRFTALQEQGSIPNNDPASVPTLRQPPPESCPDALRSSPQKQGTPLAERIKIRDLPIS